MKYNYNSSNQLTLDPRIDVELALGNVEGLSEGHKFGYAVNLPDTVVIGNTATWEDVWSYGGQRTAPTASFTPFQASDDNADTHDITWTYLDAAGLEQTVTVALTGTTPVTLGVTALDVYRGFVDDTTAPAGDVHCTTVSNHTAGVPDDAAEVLALILPIDGQTQQLCGKVPSTVRRVVNHITINLLRDSGAATSSIMVFQTRANGGVWRTRKPINVTAGSAYSEHVQGIILEPLMDYRVRVRDISDSNTSISATMSFTDKVT